MKKTFNLLFLGASYGSLFACKLALAGHDACLVCLPEEEKLINERGIVIRLPVRGLEKPVEITARDLRGRITAGSAQAAEPGGYDLVVLAMQEPQYAAAGVRELMQRVAASGRPCVSIMNMPPPPFMARLPGVDVAALENCYTDMSVWQEFDPALVTLASPDPQAFRPPGEPVNTLQVGLPTNFKVAEFPSVEHNAWLRQLEADIDALRYPTADGDIELPVKLRVHESLFVPLAKWLMLLTGNYRCVGDSEIRSIHDAVHGDLEQSRRIYQWVGDLCLELGAGAGDLVPFEKYARAAENLGNPSSAARALAGGAKNIERVDRLVQLLAAGKGRQLDEIDRIVARVDGWLQRNREA
jgi:hypothetical protein